jgi:hypothetical protein
MRLLLHPVDQLVLGVLHAHAGHLLQPATLLTDELVQLLLTLGDGLLAPPHLARAAANVLVARLQRVRATLQRALALGDAALLDGELLAPAPRLDLPRLADLDQLFLPGQHRALPHRLGLALGVLPDARRDLVRSGLRGLQSLLLVLAPRLTSGGRPTCEALLLAQKEKCRGGDHQRHARRDQDRDHVHERSMLRRGPGPRSQGHPRRLALPHISACAVRRGTVEGSRVGRANCKECLHLRA